MKMTKLLCALVLGLPPSGVTGLAVAGTAIADNKLVEVDTQVVAHQHAVNQEEVEMGKLAQANSTSAGVKKYGATLVKDHTAGDKDLTAFAKAKGILAIPADSTQTPAEKKDKEDMTAKLKASKGADFDHMFLDMMATGHDKEIARITSDITTVTDKNLVTILTKTKPVLQAHSDTAHGLQKAATTTSSAGK